MSDLIVPAGWESRPPDPRAVEIEECVERIALALGGRLTLAERIGITRALDELVDETDRLARIETWAERL